MPASRQTRSSVQPSSAAAQATILRPAWASRLMVSSTRPAPSSGLESIATRSVLGNFLGSNAPVSRASSAVRSSSRRSRSAAMSRSRNSTSAPCEKTGSTAPRQPRTICQRRSSRASSTAVASEAPVYDCRKITIAMKAGGLGSLPAPVSRYIDSSSAWNASSNSSWRCKRKKAKSLPLRLSRLRMNCSWRVHVRSGFHRSMPGLRRGVAVVGDQMIISAGRCRSSHRRRVQTRITLRAA